jgi:putative SOS response-associated peptidase YedK
MDTDRYQVAEKGPVNFAILTTKANEAVRHIDDRMPVILKPGYEKEWLHPVGVTFFQSFPDELLASYPVTPK